MRRQNLRHDFSLAEIGNQQVERSAYSADDAFNQHPHATQARGSLVGGRRLPDPLANRGDDSFRQTGLPGRGRSGANLHSGLVAIPSSAGVFGVEPAGGEISLPIYTV